ncbi:hypothetical protein [Flavobacterium psychrophilum]|uniref:Uncharacterized protein n=1 Tax=Flavobacterium psychrophilum TaxID=96345 RepID=A0A7U2NG71_FLAPS|nr:hypothetical protein [Flavobacterium psychrophilum]OAE92003.1 hypothetical protein SU65_09555 [Flavobacterium psychrophilum]QRE04556.1 hypothetical protein H0H26_02855 [Flavobacterium psychrophilum]
MEEIKKSISAILYERTTSPLFGTLIFSWLLWNWKIPYLSFFVSEDKLNINKIDYIIANYNNSDYLITYPLISTFILLTIIPFLSNGAYWLSINFENWKSKHKNLIESKQLLTVEQSIELREQILKQEERFSKLVQDKNLEIQSLKKQIDIEKTVPKLDETTDNPNSELEKLAERIMNNEVELETFNSLTRAIQNNNRIPNDSNITKLISLLESHDIIYKPEALYKFTDTGRRFLRYITA